MRGCEGKNKVWVRAGKEPCFPLTLIPLNTPNVPLLRLAISVDQREGSGAHSAALTLPPTSPFPLANMPTSANMTLLPLSHAPATLPTRSATLLISFANGYLVSVPCSPSANMSLPLLICPCCPCQYVLLPCQCVPAPPVSMFLLALLLCPCHPANISLLPCFWSFAHDAL